MRFGHSMVQQVSVMNKKVPITKTTKNMQGKLLLQNSATGDFLPVEDGLLLRNNYFNDNICNGVGNDEVLGGLTLQHMDGYVTDDLTNFLFDVKGENG